MGSVPPAAGAGRSRRGWVWAWVSTRVHGVLRAPALPCPVPTPVGDRDAVRAALPVVLGVPLSAFAAGSAQPSPRSLSPLCSLCFHPGYGETGWGVAMLRPPHPPTRRCVGAPAPNSQGSWFWLCLAPGTRLAPVMGPLGAVPLHGCLGGVTSSHPSLKDGDGRGPSAQLVRAGGGCPLP